MRRPRAPARSRGGSPLRPLVAWLVVIGAGLGFVALLDDRSDAAGTVNAVDAEGQVAEGGQLYQRYCAVCHANDGSGVDGVAPPIDTFSYAAIDLTMRTGRMPLADARRGVRGRVLSDAERSAVMAYLTPLFDLDGRLPDPPSGDAARGREVYALNCAQCHGASGGGGLAGDDVKVPAVVGLEPLTIASATREGPFQMPRFGPEVVSDQDVGDIAAFLDERVHEAQSPLGLAELSKFEVIAFASLLAVAVVLVAAIVGGARHRPEGRDDEGVRE